MIIININIIDDDAGFRSTSRTVVLSVMLSDWIDNNLSGGGGGFLHAYKFHCL